MIDLLCNKMTGGGSLTCKVDRVWVGLFSRVTNNENPKSA